MPPSPSVLADLRPLIDQALQVRLGQLLPRLGGYDPVLEPVAEELRGFLDAGKRIRPALLLLGYEAGGGSDPQAVLGPALSLELLHTFALVHDDVIDRAPTRRGRPSVHERFAGWHAEQSLHGDGAGFGAAMAILVGDLAFVQADECFLDVDPTAVRAAWLVAAFRRFTILREEVMAGQVLDVHTAAARRTDRTLALRVATLKSGRYSVSRPLQIGALLAGADDTLVEGLGRFGDPLGRAFQVRDDLLGVFGEEALTGKSAASDLAEGKRTLLIAEAAQRLAPGDWQHLDARLGDGELDADEAARLRGLLEDCGARAAAERYVTEAVAEARAELTALSMPSVARERLHAVADELGQRRA